MNNTNKQKLDSVQAQALRIACGAAHGTATAALQVEMGELPLQLRRLQLQLQYAVKVKSEKGHPACEVFKPHWTTRSGKFSENTEPVYTKVRYYIDDMDITENDSVMGEPLWCRKSCQVDLSVSKLGNKDENPALLCTLSRDLINSYDGYLHIYTDASKLSCGRTAAAFVYTGTECRIIFPSF